MRARLPGHPSERKRAKAGTGILRVDPVRRKDTAGMVNAANIACVVYAYRDLGGQPSPGAIRARRAHAKHARCRQVTGSGVPDAFLARRAERRRLGRRSREQLERSPMRRNSVEAILLLAAVLPAFLRPRRVPTTPSSTPVTTRTTASRSSRMAWSAGGATPATPTPTTATAWARGSRSRSSRTGSSRRSTTASPSPLGPTSSSTTGAGSATSSVARRRTSSSPVAMQWNFFVAQHWSALGEVGVLRVSTASSTTDAR